MLYSLLSTAAPPQQLLGAPQQQQQRLDVCAAGTAVVIRCSTAEQSTDRSEKRSALLAMQIAELEGGRAQVLTGAVVWALQRAEQQEFVAGRVLHREAAEASAASSAISRQAPPWPVDTV